jgi:preprotein translocase subunit YajC
VHTWVYLIPLLLLAGMLLYAQRSRRKQLAEEIQRAERIGVGTEVMTTSGVYGTVVARNADATVQLAIAPGVEVKWALAALRDAESIPAQFRSRSAGDGRSSG